MRRTSAIAHHPAYPYPQAHLYQHSDLIANRHGRAQRDADIGVHIHADAGAAHCHSDRPANRDADAHPRRAL